MASSSGPPDSETEMLLFVPGNSRCPGVSAAMSVMLPDSSWLCMTLSASAGSWAAPKSANVLVVSSPPKTDW